MVGLKRTKVFGGIGRDMNAKEAREKAIINKRALEEKEISDFFECWIKKITERVKIGELELSVNRRYHKGPEYRTRYLDLNLMRREIFEENINKLKEQKYKIKFKDLNGISGPYTGELFKISW